LSLEVDSGLVVERVKRRMAVLSASKFMVHHKARQPNELHSKNYSKHTHNERGQNIPQIYPIFCIATRNGWPDQRILLSVVTNATTSARVIPSSDFVIPAYMHHHHHQHHFVSFSPTAFLGRVRPEQYRKIRETLRPQRAEVGRLNVLDIHVTGI